MLGSVLNLASEIEPRGSAVFKATALSYLPRSVNKGVCRRNE